MIFNKWKIGLYPVFAFCTLWLLPASAAGPPDDQNLSFRVKEALRGDPRIDALNVNVSADSGIVTLIGTVRGLAAKKYADLEAKKINGVRGVINKIVVSTWPRSDTNIIHDILRRFSNCDLTKFRDIRVKAVNGQVTLSGQVDSWAKWKEAELLASEVRGVKSVGNKVDIIYTKKRPDTEIRTDIIATIDRDVYLCGLPISVTVKNGIVTLRGSVASAYQKHRAFDDAVFVANVKRARNFIEVEGRASKGVRRETPVPSDEQLKKNVRDELYRDLFIIDPFEIAVESTDGNITLHGTVPSYYQKRLASQDALDVVGVASVTNLLLVGTIGREDRAISIDIEFEFDNDYSLHGKNINVHVKNGVVTLSGEINTFYEKAHAAEVASRVLGVKDIINAIKVDSASKYTDTALRNRIKERLASDAETRWAADQITVEVKYGRVTLAGDVDTWPEYREAAHIALSTDGMRGLDNRLTIAGVAYR